MTAWKTSSSDVDALARTERISLVAASWSWASASRAASAGRVVRLGGATLWAQLVPGSLTGLRFTRGTRIPLPVTPSSVLLSDPTCQEDCAGRSGRMPCRPRVGQPDRGGGGCCCVGGAGCCSGCAATLACSASRARRTCSWAARIGSIWASSSRPALHVLVLAQHLVLGGDDLAHRREVALATGQAVADGAHTSAEDGAEGDRADDVDDVEAAGVEQREDRADEEPEPGAGEGSGAEDAARVSRPVTRSSCLRSVPTMSTSCTGNSWSER